MKLAVTIDVEEEGLFRGRYEKGDGPVENVSRLALLDPFFCELEIRPTLLVTYQVARSARARDHVLRAAERWKGEIGAHLHYWNTPPIEPLPHADPVPSEQIPRSLLAAKIDTLVHAVRDMGVCPRSFRMGRFSMGPNLFPLLEEKGFLADGSIAPWRSYFGGPDHVSAPADPYFPDPLAPTRKGGSGVLEVPLTILPASDLFASLLRRLGRMRGAGAARLSIWCQRVFLLPAQPAWTGLRRLNWAARLHRRRGGRALTFFFHSSELMPGAYPPHRTNREVGRFLLRLESFLRCLRREECACFTMSELHEWYSKAS